VGPLAVTNREISFQVGRGELVGVIGPNGAGKSTPFDLLTGFPAPDAGHVRLDGVSIAGLRPDETRRRGVDRTFQKLKPFGGMTVLENVMVGAIQKSASPRETRTEAERALASVGLSDRAHPHATTLAAARRDHRLWAWPTGGTCWSPAAMSSRGRPRPCSSPRT
jgi:ABC-type branched-subunit amino acid transport system ATPase component